MKTINFKIRTIAIAIFATLTISTITVPAFASKAKTASVKPVLQPTVAFVGTEGSSSVFSVQNSSETPVKFLLTVTDAEGNKLFSQLFETAAFSKTFKFVADQNASAPLDLSFKLEVPATGEKHSFEVNASTEIVKDIQVTKI